MDASTTVPLARTDSISDLGGIPTGAVGSARAEQCRRNAQAKSARKRQQAFDALGALTRDGRAVTKATVARRAGVSVVFLRSHPDLIQAIEAAERKRPAPTSGDESPGLDRAKDRVISALRRRLEALEQSLHEKDALLRQKQREIDQLYGKLAVGRSPIEDAPGRHLADTARRPSAATGGGTDPEPSP